MAPAPSKLISKMKWFSKASTILLSAALPFCLSGCMGVYEGGFECSPEKGVGCKSISEVNEMVNQCSVSSIQCSECTIPTFSPQNAENLPSSQAIDIWYSPLFIKDQIPKPSIQEKGSLVI